MSTDQSTIPTEQHVEAHVASEPSPELLQAISHLFDEPIDPEGLMEERAVKGLTPHLQPGETMLMANTVFLARTGCLPQMFGMRDSLHCVAITDSRVLVASMGILGPSKKAKIFPYEQIVGVFTNRRLEARYWILQMADKKVLPFYSTWVCGPGSKDFLRAMFAHFYSRAKQVVVPSDFANREPKEALAANKLKVLIN